MSELLNKLNSFISIAQIWQIFLVAFIIAIFSKSTKVVGVGQLSTISLGFIFNFCYIVFEFLSTKGFPFFSSAKIENSTFVALAFVFDLLTPFCFYTAFVSWCFNVSVHPNVIAKFKKFNFIIYELTLGKIIYSVALFVLLLLIALLFVSKFDANNTVLTTLRALYHFGGTLAVCVFFFKLRKSHMANDGIWIGFIIWAIVQCLFIPGILNNNRAMLLGYTLSLIAKLFIIAGMFYWYVAYALESSKEAVREQQAKIQFERSSKYFADILAVVFHELNFPLRNLGKSMEEMYRYIARDARVKFREVENNYELVRTVITLAKNSYLKDGSVVDDIDFLATVDYYRIVRVNNLLAMAIRSVKRIYKSDVEIKTEYGSNCYIECLQAETIQVFMNLIKNAIEAYDTSGVRRICVRSYISRNGNNGNKDVVVEIQDYASGIEEENLVRMWDAGFTTKETDAFNTVRGQGLYVVKEFVGRMPGATISVASKIEKNEAGIGSGTLFTIIFPKKELPEIKQ